MSEKTKINLLKRVMYAIENSRFEHITAQEIAFVANIHELSDTCPITRGLIRELIDDGALIGSTYRGYHIMDTGKEVQQCLNGLLKRQMGITKRIQSIYDAATAKGIL